MLKLTCYLPLLLSDWLSDHLNTWTLLGSSWCQMAPGHRPQQITALHGWRIRWVSEPTLSWTHTCWSETNKQHLDSEPERHEGAEIRVLLLSLLLIHNNIIKFIQQQLQHQSVQFWRVCWVSEQNRRLQILGPSKSFILFSFYWNMLVHS